MIVTFKAGAAGFGYAYHDGEVAELSDDDFKVLSVKADAAGITVVRTATTDEAKAFKDAQAALAKAAK